MYQPIVIILFKIKYGPFFLVTLGICVSLNKRYGEIKLVFIQLI